MPSCAWAAPTTPHRPSHFFSSSTISRVNSSAKVPVSAASCSAAAAAHTRNTCSSGGSGGGGRRRRSTRAPRGRQVPIGLVNDQGAGWDSCRRAPQPRGSGRAPQGLKVALRAGAVAAAAYPRLCIALGGLRRPPHSRAAHCGDLPAQGHHCSGHSVSPRRQRSQPETIVGSGNAACRTCSCAAAAPAPLHGSACMRLARVPSQRLENWQAFWNHCPMRYLHGKGMKLSYKHLAAASWRLIGMKARGSARMHGRCMDSDTPEGETGVSRAG